LGKPIRDLLTDDLALAASSAALIEVTSVRVDELVDAALCMSFILSR
jgi:hypothetical protein